VKMVLVGEAWGRGEEVLGHPLVGASGRELAYQLAQASVAPGAPIAADT
jgi:uracil-DNA glycosylase